jgi:hypothetical protein
MYNHALHITNGQNLTNFLIELDFTSDILTWQEMLCEGPTTYNIGTDEFIKLRTDFLKTYYDIDLDANEFKDELDKLNHTDKYKEIILWFEYDLCSHINMVAVVNLLQQKKIKLPIYLVCSGRIEGQSNLKGLSELTSEQLMDHYKAKTLLNSEDIQECIDIWQIYCGKDHNLLKPYIVKKSSFTYLSNCLKAHLKRFPDSKSGLTVLEKNILEIVKEQNIKSKHHLLGYALNFQGYYGYSDMQFSRIIEKLNIFFIKNEDSLTLNRKGYEALIEHHNYASEINCNMIYGGVNKLDFQFNVKLNKLVKTVD